MCWSQHCSYTGRRLTRFACSVVVLTDSQLAWLKNDVCGPAVQSAAVDAGVVQVFRGAANRQHPLFQLYRCALPLAWYKHNHMWYLPFPNMPCSASIAQRMKEHPHSSKQIVLTWNISLPTIAA